MNTPLQFLKMETRLFVKKLIDEGMNVRLACGLGLSLDKGEAYPASKEFAPWRGFAIEAGFVKEEER